jgi:DHA2 family multidrug resistance protein
MVIALAVVAAFGFAVFVAWELTDAHPVVDLRLFARPNFLYGALTLSVAYGLFFGNIVLLPMWLQQWVGYTATWAGMAMAPVGVLAIMLTPLVGKKVGVWDPRWMATGAFVCFSLVLWLRSRFTLQTDFVSILIPTVIQGAALSFFFIPLTTLTLSGLDPSRVPAAAGLSNFVRITAGAMGTSVATTVWQDRAVMHHAHLAERLTAGDPVTDEALRTVQSGGFGLEQALAQVERLVNQQAYTRAADDVFLVSAGIFLLLIPLVWRTARPPRLGRAAPTDAGGAH